MARISSEIQNKIATNQAMGQLGGSMMSVASSLGRNAGSPEAPGPGSETANSPFSSALISAANPHYKDRLGLGGYTNGQMGDIAMS
jgi:hypothetical protein